MQLGIFIFECVKEKQIVNQQIKSQKGTLSIHIGT